MKLPIEVGVIFNSFREKQYNRITGHLPGNIQKACELVQAEAKANVSQTGGKHPQIKTGQLRDNIKTNIYQKGKTVKGFVGITQDEFYGRMLEFGTIRIPAYPWLFPALKAKQNEVQRLLKG